MSPLCMYNLDIVPTQGDDLLVVGPIWQVDLCAGMLWSVHPTWMRSVAQSSTHPREEMCGSWGYTGHFCLPLVTAGTFLRWTRHRRHLLMCSDAACLRACLCTQSGSPRLCCLSVVPLLLRGSFLLLCL